MNEREVLEMLKSKIDAAAKVGCNYAIETEDKNAINKALNTSAMRSNFTLEDMEKSFEAGGDWRIACKNLSEGIYTKEQWANNNDFDEFIKENYNL
jgi:hypothetical protein